MDNSSRPDCHQELLFRNDHLYTLNATPGITVYGEKTIKYRGKEYRSFTPKRSKLAACLKLGYDVNKILGFSKVLYLGAANGTTVSHLSDLLPDGTIYSLEISPRCFRDLLVLAKDRKNIVPLLNDASKPGDYRYMVPKVDMIYQDISQRDQVDIFLRNCDMSLRRGGGAFLMLKANCVDSTIPASMIYSESRQALENGGLKVLESIDISRYQKGHMGFIAVK